VRHLIRTIDAHAGGQPLRLVVDGTVRPSGATLAQRAEWLRRHADRVRRTVVLPPRGHHDMVAAQLLDPLLPGSHAGIVFMDAGGYRASSGHGIMAATTIAIERELLYDRAADQSSMELAFETAVGIVRARARIKQAGDRTRVDSVTITGVPAFVYMPGHTVSLGSRELRVDIAFGGVFYAIVDTESVGIPLIDARVPELRRMGMELTRAANTSIRVAHPALPLTGVAGVVFTGPPQDPESHLRAVTVTGHGVVNWSPGATAMPAVMSVLDAMGLLPDDGPFVQEGLAGSVFRGRGVARTAVGELPALVTEIEGTAWITGEHTFYADEDDPFKEGVGKP